MVDVDPNTFNINVNHIKPLINSRTKAIVPVHLFGQSAEMEDIMILAKENNLFVIEDNARLLDVIILLEMEAAKQAQLVI